MTAKTTEIGHMTWGIMRGVMALATQKVDEFTKEGGASNGSTSCKSNHRSRNKSQGDGFYQESKTWNSNGGNGGNGVTVSRSSGGNISSSAWDDWDNDGYRKHASDNGDSWAGWDDDKDDDGDNFGQSASNGKTSTHTVKSDGTWSGAGFN